MRPGQIAASPIHDPECGAGAAVEVGRSRVRGQAKVFEPLTTLRAATTVAAGKRTSRLVGQLQQHRGTRRDEQYFRCLLHLGRA